MAPETSHGGISYPEDTLELVCSGQYLIDRNAFYQLNHSGVASSVIVLLKPDGIGLGKNLEVKSFDP